MFIVCKVQVLILHQPSQSNVNFWETHYEFPSHEAAVCSHPAASDYFPEEQPRWPTTDVSALEVDALETKAVKEVLLTTQIGAVEVEEAVSGEEAEVQATVAKVCGTSQLS